MRRSLLLLLLVACSEALPAAPDAGARDSDAGTVPDFVAATSYCETIETGFCAFYLRCGRIAATDLDDCRRIFRETCETKYEPRYVDLETAGLLRLSTRGVAACLDSLDTIECARQPYDLAGACADMWVGDSPLGSPCGLDIESLVCRPGSSCRIDTSLCGTCVTVVRENEPCGVDHGNTACEAGFECVDGTCRERGDVRAPCDDAHRCRLGLSCIQGACAGPNYVAVGETCDQLNRCPFKSTCIAGKCVASAMLGESCDGRACASGWCNDAKTCVAPLNSRAACTSSAQCESGLCIDHACEPMPGRCIVK